MLLTIVSIIIILLLVAIMFLHRRETFKIESLKKQNQLFLESIEKYVEIFNENNVKDIINNKDKASEKLANNKIMSIKKEYKSKLMRANQNLTEEHEMLIDFVTLSLSLLIKTPPSLRKKIIEENTDNEVIKKILTSKLASIENHYVPVSILEIALSEDNK